MSEIVRMHVEVEPEPLPARADGEGGDRRHLVPSIPVVNDGRLAAGRPRAPDGRNQLEARFVGKYEVGVQPGRALLGDDIAPPNDGAMRTPDATGHVGDAVTLIEERHGPASARLQRGLTAMWSHTAVVRPRAAVRFLYWAQ